MFTVTPRLVQQFRYEVGCQFNKGFTSTNYGSGRGLELIPLDASDTNGSTDASVSPSLALGKGWEEFRSAGAQLE
jgi:hypothetical protein